MTEEDLKHVNPGDTVWWVAKTEDPHNFNYHTIYEGKYYDHNDGCEQCELGVDTLSTFDRSFHIAVNSDERISNHRWINKIYCDIEKALEGVKAKLKFSKRRINNAIVNNHEIMKKLKSEKRIIDRKYDETVLRLNQESI